MISLAERLGKAVADSPQAAALRTVRKEFDAKPDIVALLREYQEHGEKLAQLEMDNKPVEVDDKHKLQELRDKLLSDETFKKLSAAQVEYVDLMRKVNTAIQQQLAETESPAE